MFVKAVDSIKFGSKDSEQDKFYRYLVKFLLTFPNNFK